MALLESANDGKDKYRKEINEMLTTLPFGTNKLEARRTLTTESLAVFMPFKVQEIQPEPEAIELATAMELFSRDKN